MFEKVTKSFSYGAHTVTLETGEIARQSDGAVLCSVGDTVVLATVVARRVAKPGQDFFPLTVDYVEKTYAAGRIPGGFFKREGRPSEKETLTSRLIDRPLRPLFPDGFYNEVQVVIHVLSVDAEIDPDIPALIGASAAVSLAGIPFKGPIGAARVGYVDGQYVINPTATQLKTSQLNLVVAGTERAVLMVESEADQLPEDVMLGGVMHGHQQMQVVINAIHDMVRDAGKPAWEWQPAAKNEALMASVVQNAGQALREAYQMRSKQARQNRIKEIYASTISDAAANATANGQPAVDGNELSNMMFDLEAKIVRSQILDGEPRIDGRDTRTVRPDRDSSRCIAAYAWFGSLYARRNAGAGDRNARHQAGRADHRRAAGRVSRALHASLQHATVCDRRNRPRRRTEAARGRPRPPGEARTGGVPAVVRRFSVFAAGRLRDY